MFEIAVIVYLFLGLVIGALLGTQDGRNIEIFNSFELQFDLFDDGQIVINMEYYKTKEEQCKFVILYYRKFMLNELIKVLEINQLKGLLLLIRDRCSIEQNK